MANAPPESGNIRNRQPDLFRELGKNSFAVFLADHHAERDGYGGFAEVILPVFVSSGNETGRVTESSGGIDHVARFPSVICGVSISRRLPFLTERQDSPMMQ